MTLSNSFGLTSVFSVFKSRHSDVQDTQSTYSGIAEEKIPVEEKQETVTIGEDEGMIPIDEDDDKGNAEESEKYSVIDDFECEPISSLSPTTTFFALPFSTHFKEKKAFFELLPKLLDRQCELGNLNASKSTETTEECLNLWTMTDQGMHAVLDVYGDIKEAMEFFWVSEETKASIGLRSGVTVEPVLQERASSLHNRIGASWPLPIKTAILKNPEANPFLYGVHIHWYQRAKWAMGVVRKAERSDGFADLLIPRLLGLAQLCGIEHLSFSDVMELAALAPYFEKIARSHIARVVGNIDKSEITNLVYSNSIDGQILGSTLYLRQYFPLTASNLSDKMVKIGEIRERKVVVTYPKPLEECSPVDFEAKSFPLNNGEPVYMLPGWALSLAHRPPQFDSSDGLQCLYRDIHGSPHYAEWKPERFKIKVRRTISGTLAGRPSRFGSLVPPNVSGQGVFGVPCGCTTRNPIKYLRIFRTTMVNGVELNGIREADTDISYHDIRYIWTAGDLVMQRFRADAYPQGTYIQVPGECLYCAVNRAMGTGCWVLILGGFPKRTTTVRKGLARQVMWNSQWSSLPIAVLGDRDSSDS